MKNYKKIKQLSVGLLFSLAIISCTNDRDNDSVPNNSNQMAYDAANVTVGSQLYNDFTKTPGFDGPSSPNVSLDDIVNFKDFYRCKNCHGWDLKARFASYINRGPKANRPDVSTVQLVNFGNADITELFNKIKNTGGAAVDPQRTADGLNPSLGGNNHPDYGTILTDDQIWDLVKFLREGALDVDQLYTIELSGAYPTGKRSFANVGMGGDLNLGQNFYTKNCASCHGANGTSIDISGASLGKLMRTKPYEVQHKVLSGELGTSMGPTPATLEEMKGLLRYASDTTAFPDL